MLGFRDRGLRRTRLFAIAGALATVLVAGGVACSSSSSTGLPPTTGILIRAETLTAGHGCGVGPTQLFKYAVVVFQYGGAGDPAERASYDTVATSNVFDCYTDGAFISLPAVGDNTSYRLEVFAYNRPQYEDGRPVIDDATVLGRGRDMARLQGFPGELRDRTSPTWTTECIATQQERVQALASCDPLAPGLAGVPGGTAGPTTITLATTRFELPDGRVATCAAASPDGDADAGSDGGADAEADADAPDAADGGDTSAEDAGAPISFSKVRVRTRIGTQIIADSVVDCTSAYSAEVAPEPVRYDLDVGLLDSAGERVDPGAETTCTVTSTTGKTSSAVCPGFAPAGR